MGASGVCRAVIRKRRSGLFCPSIWKRTRCSPIGTRRHAVGVYPTDRSSTYTSANGSAFTLRHLDSCGAGADGAVATGVAIGAGTAFVVTLGSGVFGSVAFGAVTTGGAATGAASSDVAAFGVSAGTVRAGGAALGDFTGAVAGGVTFALDGRAGGSTSRVTAGAGAAACGGSASRRSPAHVPTPSVSRQSAPNATRTGRDRIHVRRRSCPISRRARALHARRSPAAASRKALARSVAVAYLAS